MRRRRPVGSAVVAVAIVLASVLPASAEQVVTHSGTIVSIAPDARTFVLAEVGPWQLRGGETVVTHRTITLTPDTAYAVVLRSREAPSGFPGDFVEVPVGPEDVFLGDWVTVVCRHVGPRLEAVTIIVPEQSPSE